MVVNLRRYSPARSRLPTSVANCDNQYTIGFGHTTGGFRPPKGQDQKRRPVWAWIGGPKSDNIWVKFCPGLEQTLRSRSKVRIASDNQQVKTRRPEPGYPAAILVSKQSILKIEHPFLLSSQISNLSLSQSTLTTTVLFLVKDLVLQSNPKDYLHVI